MLLVVMAQFLKMDTLIPLHGILQLFSNGSRAWLLRASIEWKIGKDAIFGAILGAIAGCFYVVDIPRNAFDLALGVFILFIVFLPKVHTRFHFPGKWLLIGFLSCSVGLFMGAVGPLVGACLLSENLQKKPMMSTQATLQVVIHLAKVLVFSLLGFKLAPWGLLLAGAIFCGYVGTFIGTKIIEKIPESIFRKISIILICILSGRLIFSGITGL